MIVNKTKQNKNYRIVDFAVPSHRKVKIKENEKWYNYLDFARGEKAMELEGVSDTNCYWCTRSDL